MFPPAPGLFSTITCCFHSGARREPNERATMSVAPPGGKGTTMRTSFSGYCAYAGAANARPRSMLDQMRTLMFEWSPSTEFVQAPSIVGEHLGLLCRRQVLSLAQLADGMRIAAVPVREIGGVDDLVVADELHRLR